MIITHTQLSWLDYILTSLRLRDPQRMVFTHFEKDVTQWGSAQNKDKNKEEVPNE